MRRKKDELKPRRTCRECGNCSPITEEKYLSVEGKPILGKCPFMTRRKVLLSEKACESNFKPLQDG